MIRKVAVIGIFVLSGFLTSSCSDHSVESPVEPQFARKVKPPPAEPVLEEFWVYRNNVVDSECLGGEIIHIVVSGDFQYIGTNLTHDNFFNGVRDNVFHFEYGGFRGPEDPATQWSPDGTRGHIDVCFKGEQLDHIYGDGSGGLRFFVDYPSTSVGGTGADPFAVSLGAVINGGGPHLKSKGFRPTGVVEDGNLKSREVPSVESKWHDETFTGVRSYAVWESNPPAGYIFFDGITVLNPTCEVSTAVEGKGKNKTEVTNTTITAEVVFDFGAEDLGELAWDQAYWTEGHLRVTSITGDFLRTFPYEVETFEQDGMATYTWLINDNLAGETVAIEFLVDFLIAQSASLPWEGENVFDYVYHPGRNDPSLKTTAGFDGNLWDPTDNVSKGLDDPLFPVAHSNRPEVECGGG